jgi:hypothetical protein
MSTVDVEHELTLWMTDDIPARMFCAGRRWHVTDTPTRLRYSIGDNLEQTRALYGWRFQATDESGATYVFDVYRQQDGWHVHRTYF